METDHAPRPLLRQGDELDIAMEDDPGEARRVRRAVAGVLSASDVDPNRSQDALVAISELVSNALVHGGPPRRVHLTLRSGALEVQVFDGSRRPPRMIEAPGPEPGGRGLHLVSRLASAWGTEFGPDGKRVWCIVDLS